MVSQLLAKVKILNFPLIWQDKFRIASDDQFENKSYELETSSPEYRRLEQEILKNSSSLKVESIQRIQNKPLWYSYEKEANRL